MSRLLRIVGLVLLVAVAGCRLETATGPVGSASFVSRFDDVQELALGHTVRVSDVVVGTVVGIELDGYEALVEYSVVNGRELPEGTTAAIGSTSLLGENYVQLRLPDPPVGPPLSGGEEIPGVGTVTTVEELAVQLLALTRAIQGRDLAAVVDAGAVAIGPRGAELNQLIGSLGELSGGLAAQSTVIEGLLLDAEILLAALAPNAVSIGATLDVAAAATSTLARQRVRLVDTVEDLTVLAATLDREVLAPHLDRLSGIVADLDPVTAALVAEREVLRRVLERVVIVTERVPDAVHEGGILAYAWLHKFVIGGDVVDTAPAERRSLPDILLPDEVRER